MLLSEPPAFAMFSASRVGVEVGVLQCFYIGLVSPLLKANQPGCFIFPPLQANNTLHSPGRGILMGGNPTHYFCYIAGLVEEGGFIATAKRHPSMRRVAFLL